MTISTELNADTVMQAIERLRPVIEAHREAAEQERRLPDAVVQAMQKEGLFDLWLPREYGGAELGLLPYLEAIQALSRIDASVGWTLANTATACVQAAFLPEAGAAEVYGSGSLTAGSIVPRGRAVPVEGGYRVSGRWPLSSGCHHAGWVGANCLIFDGDAPRFSPQGMPMFTMMCVPRGEFTILDTWYSTGMRGTGSADFVVEDVFVPQHRTFPLFGAQSRLPGSLYKLSIDQHFLTALSNVALGIARASIDAFMALAIAKTPTLSQTTLAARPTVHAEVAKAEASYQAARAYMHEVAREMSETIEAGEHVSEATEARRRLACTYAAEACEKVVDSMYRLGGTSSIVQGSLLDRCLRDVHTVNQHLAVSPVWWEKTGQFYFGQGLGMP